MRDAESRLQSTKKAIEQQEQAATALGKTGSTTARQYEKLNEQVKKSEERLTATTSAFKRGEASASQMRSALLAADKAADSLNGRLKDSAARLADFKGKSNLGEFAQIGQVISGVGIAIGTATQTIGVFTDAVVGATGAFFNFVKTASDYGSKIQDIKDKTGLGAETLTTLKFAAEQSGKSLEDLSAPIGKFSKLLGQAADGSDKAAATLERFGLDPKTAIDDLDGSLAKAIDKIREMPEGAERAYAAQLLFGKGGMEVVGVLKALDGGLEASKRRARELGITLTDEDVKAADDFGDTLNALDLQAKGTFSKFALNYAPMFTKAMQKVSESLADNRSEVESWGRDSLRSVYGVIGYWNDLNAKVRQYEDTIRRITHLPELPAISSNPLGVDQGIAIADQIKKRGEVYERDNLAHIGDSSSFDFSRKLRSAGDDAADDMDKSAKSAKAIKDHFKEIQQTWTAATLSQFAKFAGFTVTSTTGGQHNTGSLHYQGKAVDVRTFDKAADEIVQLMVKAIQSGIRVVDERIRPAGQKVWGGPHVHLEENDKKASSFSPLLSGKQLDFLKALDEERIAGKGKSITSTLRQITEESLRLDREGLDQLRNGVEKLGDAWTDFVQPLTPVEEAMKRVNAVFTDPDVLKALEQYGTYADRLRSILQGTIGASAALSKRPELPNPFDNKEGGTSSSGVSADQFDKYNDDQATAADNAAKAFINTLSVPPKLDPWNNFWAQMRSSLKKFQDGLPSIKQALGENLLDSISRIGDVFAGAVQQWDGTARGFFLSIAQGFKQMAKDIIAELIRVMIQAIVTKLILSFIGGGAPTAGLGGGGHEMAGLGGGAGGHFAAGGDPPLGKISLVGERGPELFIPKTAGTIMSNDDTRKLLAGGDSQQIVQNNHFHFHANQNGQFAKESAEQAARRATAALNHTAKRNNGFPG